MTLLNFPTTDASRAIRRIPEYDLRQTTQGSPIYISPTEFQEALNKEEIISLPELNRETLLGYEHFARTNKRFYKTKTRLPILTLRNKNLKKYLVR